MSFYDSRHFEWPLGSKIVNNYFSIKYDVTLIVMEYDNI